jgi:hypothetical protein
MQHFSILVIALCLPLISACSGSGGASSAISPSGINTTPAAREDRVAEFNEASGTQVIYVLDNDGFGFDGAATTPIEIIVPPEFGTATVDTQGTAISNDDTIIYTPGANYSPTDQLRYRIADSDGEAATATVYLLIALAPGTSIPAPVNDEAMINEDNGLTIIDILANDNFGSDGAGNVAVSLQVAASNGVATINTQGTPSDPADDTLEYTPNSGFYGSDQVTYLITDADSDARSATVTLNVSQNVEMFKDAILSSRNPDCASYDSRYEAAVRDIQNDSDFNMAANIYDRDTYCSISSNSIPNHDFNEAGANFVTDVVAIDNTFRLNKSPSKATTPSALSILQYDGILLNGVLVDQLSRGCYDPTAPDADPTTGNTPAGCTDTQDWRLDPLFSANNSGIDDHNAHTRPDGTYHYHGNPTALFNDTPAATGSPVIGFAADGFPIYGSYFDDGASVRKALSSYQLKSGSRGARTAENPGGTYTGMYIDDYMYNAGSGDLDECNGMTVDGQYGYYVTDEYPWILACLSGSPHSSFSKQ